MERQKNTMNSINVKRNVTKTTLFSINETKQLVLD